MHVSRRLCYAPCPTHARRRGRATAARSRLRLRGGSCSGGESARRSTEMNLAGEKSASAKRLRQMALIRLQHVQQPLHALGSRHGVRMWGGGSSAVAGPPAGTARTRHGERQGRTTIVQLQWANQCSYSPAACGAPVNPTSSEQSGPTSKGDTYRLAWLTLALARHLHAMHAVAVPSGHVAHL